MPSTPAGSSSGAGELVPRYEDVQNLHTTRDELQRAAREEIACPSCRAQVASLLRGASGSLAEMQATEIASRTVIHAIYERILGDKVRTATSTAMPCPDASRLRRPQPLLQAPS